MQLLQKNDSRMKSAYDYCDAIISHKTTPGGLWHNTQLSQWDSNRYAANASSVCAGFGKYLPGSDSKRKSFIDFFKKSN